ncbi:MAG: hypothetical protein ACR2F1_00190 [Nitrososphaeraceae archaeon]
MRTIFVTSVLLVHVIFFATFHSFTSNIKAQEPNDEYYMLARDGYAQNYDEDYFKDNAIKINEINNMVQENNRQLAKQGLAEEKNMDRARLLASESKIGFVLPTFTMAAYDKHFLSFFFKICRCTT